MKLKLILCCIGLMSMVQLGAQSYGAPYSSVECLNVEMDGSITVKVTGSGRNMADAKEQAKKNAVYNVIFKGVKTEDRNSTVSKPLVYDVNPEEKYEDFINAFFADGGKYTDFVSMEDRRLTTAKRKKQDVQVEWSLTVRVLRPELKEYLTQQNIIKGK